jgi:uncharacterized protein (TIGR02246 family)
MIGRSTEDASIGWESVEMICRVALVLFCLLTCAPVLAGPREDALAAYQKFFDLFTTNNHDRIVTLFAPDALFFGTRSTELATTQDEIRQYFVEALTGKRGLVKATSFEQAALVLSDSIVAISGKWQSERTSEGKMVTAGPSRITVVMQRRGDRWLIVQFHNSPTPRLVP